MKRIKPLTKSVQGEILFESTMWGCVIVCLFFVHSEPSFQRGSVEQRICMGLLHSPGANQAFCVPGLLKDLPDQHSMPDGYHTDTSKVCSLSLLSLIVSQHFPATHQRSLCFQVFLTYSWSNHSPHFSSPCHIPLLIKSTKGSSLQLLTPLQWSHPPSHKPPNLWVLQS